ESLTRGHFKNQKIIDLARSIFELSMNFNFINMPVMIFSFPYVTQSRLKLNILFIDTLLFK
ncbi:MAG: hypothetical protein VXZ35_07485, partial [Pseudomonadota bacterium]|nr:hypothetical protein [Pseudomonadota bacterium]